MSPWNVLHHHRWFFDTLTEFSSWILLTGCWERMQSNLFMVSWLDVRKVNQSRFGIEPYNLFYCYSWWRRSFMSRIVCYWTYDCSPIILTVSLSIMSNEFCCFNQLHQRCQWNNDHHDIPNEGCAHRRYWLIGFRWCFRRRQLWLPNLYIIQRWVPFVLPPRDS